MDYVFLNQAAQDDIIAKAIRSREQEHFNYELNRLNYQQILQSADVAALPQEWPENLAKFKALGGEQLAAVLKGDDYTLASQLQFRDRVQTLLSTTLSEQSKGLAVHAALNAQLSDPARMKAAVDRLTATDGSPAATPAIAK